MEKLKMIITASIDSYGAYSENIDGIYAAGDTIEDCKKDVFTVIDLMIANKKDYKLPKWFVDKKFTIEWSYDTESILKRYAKIISKPALEVLTGINQKQLHHYASGTSKPRKEQREKIETALHKLGRELIQVKLS